MQQRNFSKVIMGVLFTAGLVVAGPSVGAEAGAKTTVEHHHSARHSHGAKHWHGKSMHGPKAHRRGHRHKYGKYAGSKRHARRGGKYQKRYHTMPKQR